MRTGNTTFDKNLEDLHLDCFGNIMVLHAPSGTVISTPFMHGYPWRLISDSHCGLLPGNITLGVWISNHAIRSLATGKNQQQYTLSSCH